MAANGQLPTSHQPHADTFEGPKGYDTSVDATSKNALATNRRSRGSKMANVILALLLAVVVALAAAPAAGYKSGWAYYRRSNFIAPARFGVPVAIKLQIWVGWIKGSDSLRNILHRVAPSRFAEYTYLHEVQHGGQVAAGLAIAFLLLGGAVAFLYFLASIVWSIRRNSRSATPPGLCISGIVFGFLNMAWSIACYIVISIGTAIYTRRTVQQTYIAWPDWCFYLGFFSGVFWWIAAGVAFAESRRAKRTLTSTPHAANMTHNMTYEQPHGTTLEPKAPI